MPQAKILTLPFQIISHWLTCYALVIIVFVNKKTHLFSFLSFNNLERKIIFWLISLILRLFAEQVEHYLRYVSEW